jgi:hypothetical protein
MITAMTALDEFDITYMYIVYVLYKIQIPVIVRLLA